MKTIASGMIAIVLLVGAGGVSISNRAFAQLESANYLQTQHRALLAQWLKSKPALRLATERDCRNKQGLAASRQEYGRNYQPYYVAGDFNGDGREDFAVALIDQTRRARRFSLAIFNGPFTTVRTTVPNFLTERIDLSDGGLVTPPGKGLLAGVFQSDDCVRLLPRGKTYAMKSCL